MKNLSRKNWLTLLVWLPASLCAFPWVFGRFALSNYYHVSVLSRVTIVGGAVILMLALIGILIMVKEPPSGPSVPRPKEPK